MVPVLIFPLIFEFAQSQIKKRVYCIVSQTSFILGGLRDFPDNFHMVTAER